MIKCNEILQKTYFDSYSEFYLACAIARECFRRGIQLDMSMMRIDKDILPKQVLNYFKCLWRDGAIYLGEDYNGDMMVDSSYYMDTTCFEPLYKVLFKDLQDKYFWNFDWANSAYTDYRYTMQRIPDMGNILIHLVGHMLVCFHLEERVKKPIVIEIHDALKVQSTYIYVNLVSCCKTLKCLKGLLIMDIDFSGYNIDLDYSILCNNGMAAGRNKLWSITDKRRFLAEEGFKTGMIAILWSRKGMCKSNKIGKIVGSTIIRIDEIGETFVAVETIPINKTKEENYCDYYSIPEDKRHLFMDMLSSRPQTRSRMLSLYSLGIVNYFHTETEFITLIEQGNMVVKKVTVDGKVVDVEMSEVDAIYWLLCQYEVDFDRELYREAYNGGNPLLWDRYGEYEE